MNAARLARYEAGLTILEAAQDAGVSERTIRRLEDGQQPSAPIAKNIADAYGITVAELLGVEPRAAA